MRIAEVLAGLDADIIGLQEVDWRHPLPDGHEVLAYLAGQLGMHALEGPNLHDHRGRYGNGLLCRYPVIDFRQIPLAYGGREPRGAIDAILSHGAGAMRVLVTHLGLGYRERRMQVETLRSAAREGHGAMPTLLMGDMNEWVSRRLMHKAFTPGTFDIMVTGRTFPSRLPWFPLDCIFIGPEPAHLESRVIRDADARQASDHLPVVADIEWHFSDAPSPSAIEVP